MKSSMGVRPGLTACESKRLGEGAKRGRPLTLYTHPTQNMNIQGLMDVKLQSSQQPDESVSPQEEDWQIRRRTRNIVSELFPLGN